MRAYRRAQGIEASWAMSDELLVALSPSPHSARLAQQLGADVEVEQGARRRTMSARAANAEERARLWPGLVELFAPYANYQSWTEREIPVVILSARN